MPWLRLLKFVSLHADARAASPARARAAATCRTCRRFAHCCVGALAATIKVIVVGNGRVGKSSMTTRYCKNVFTDTYKKTIGEGGSSCRLRSGAGR